MAPPGNGRDGLAFSPPDSREMGRMSDFLSGILGRAFGGAGRGQASGMGGALKLAAAAFVLHQLMKHFGGGQGSAAQTSKSATAPPPQQGSGGILGGLFGGGGGGASGGMTGTGGAGEGLGGLLGGLEGMLGRLRGEGLSREVDSWVSTGSNQPVAPQRLAPAFDPAELDQAARQAGTDRGTFLDEVGRLLPDLVDRMTPGGRVPRDPSELQGRASGGGGFEGLLAGLLGEERRAEDTPQGPTGAIPRSGPGAALYGGSGGDAGRGAGGEAGTPRFSDDAPGPGAAPSSGPGGPPLPSSGRR
jgi:uncharacterized protein YidB (DUF937 family)